MGTNRSPANRGQKTHESKLTSKMSKFKSYAGPDSRHPKAHNYSVSFAESQVKKLG